MKAILFKEFKTARREKQVVIGYCVVLVLWGILQPLSSLLSLADSGGFRDLPEGFLHTTNFVTFLAFFLVIGVTHSNQSFLGEKQSRTLNTLLATPVSIASLIVGKWLATVALVGVMSVLIFGVQWLTYAIAARVANVYTPIVFPSLMEISSSFFQLLLLWGMGCWYGAFSWLKFDNYQSANIVSILFALPLLVAEYLAIEFSVAIWVTAPVLAVGNLTLGVVAVLLNTRDRLAQLG